MRSTMTAFERWHCLTEDTAGLYPVGHKFHGFQELGAALVREVNAEVAVERWMLL
jgi:hypothetical protein